MYEIGFCKCVNLKLNKLHKHIKTETMVQSKTLDFSGTNIFCGIDVHKKNWRINIQEKKENRV